MLDMWLSMFGLDKEQITKTAMVCSEHFRKHDLIIQPSGRVNWRKGTVPINIYHKSPEPSSTNDMENKETASSSIDKDDFYGPSKRSFIDTDECNMETDLGFNVKSNSPKLLKRRCLNANEENKENIDDIENASSSTITASETETVELLLGDNTFSYVLRNIYKKNKTVEDMSSSDFSTPEKAKKHFRV
ncbi:uncharacterized protein [Diabrotica undecimpunctata]|uniref:uncharacterized protein n=1 Tax=Diabrotica undecimpunctata TaxID=50387 RepID=UPI003B634C85